MVPACLFGHLTQYNGPGKMVPASLFSHLTRCNGPGKIVPASLLVHLMLYNSLGKDGACFSVWPHDVAKNKDQIDFRDLRMKGNISIS
jgi:hypothetical protein